MGFTKSQFLQRSLETWLDYFSPGIVRSLRVYTLLSFPTLYAESVIQWRDEFNLRGEANSRDLFRKRIPELPGRHTHWYHFLFSLFFRTFFLSYTEHNGIKYLVVQVLCLAGADWYTGCFFFTGTPLKVLSTKKLL